MKRILLFVVFTAIVVGLCSCTNEKDTHKTTEYYFQSDKFSANELSTEFESETTTYNTTKTETRENNTSKRNNLLQSKIETENNSTTERTTHNDNNTENVPPDMLILGIDDLKQINFAVETMSEEEFVNYMDKNYSSEVMNGMDTRENTKAIISKIKDRYVVVYNKTNVGEKLTIYLEDYWMHQRIYLSDTFCINFRAYPADSDAFIYEDGEYFHRIKIYETDNATVDLMEGSDNGEKFLCGNITVDNQKMNFYTFEYMSVTDFEELLSNLEFIKIGDLLEQTAIAKSTEAETENITE